jgi:hypothetical protein
VIGREVSAAPDPYEATVYHTLHGLTQATSEADRPVAVRAVFAVLEILATTASLEATGT